MERETSEGGDRDPGTHSQRLQKQVQSRSGVAPKKATAGQNMNHTGAASRNYRPTHSCCLPSSFLSCVLLLLSSSSSASSSAICLSSSLSSECSRAILPGGGGTTAAAA